VRPVWIPVTERMPEPDRRVAVWVPKGVIPGLNGVDTYYIVWWGGTEDKTLRNQWHVPLGFSIRPQQVTHWSEIPEGPAIAENGLPIG